MRKLTTEEWIEKAKIVHGDRYSYSNTEYTKAKDNVSIICRIHGVFKQTAQHHIAGHNCPKCTNNSKYTSSEFSEKAKSIHKNKYDYKKCIYINNKTKVVITCPTHGDFEQTPNNHLNGKGCPICNKVDTQDFIKKAELVHKYRYDYSKVDYKRHNRKTIITCPTHGDFEQTPSSHLSGSNCPNCVKNGFSPNKSAILYYLKITTDSNQILYKIGITNRTIETRFNVDELNKIEIIKRTNYAIGQDAYNEEQRILKKFQDYRYKGPDILSSGNTELFTKDVLRNS